MSIARNIFCWQGITADRTHASDFYPRVLGWSLADGGEDGPVFIAPGGPVAHLQAPDSGPPSWCSFLSVDDLDVSTALAEAHGGGVLVPPTDLPAGRFSVVTTPSGAVFALYQPAEADALAAPGAGTVGWVELQSTAPQDDLGWFQAAFGFSVRAVTSAAGPHHLLEVDGAPRGGVSPSASGRSAFTAWVQVDDLDETLAKVGAHGGAVVGAPTADPEIGRMAVVSDPGGAVFGLYQPA